MIFTVTLNPTLELAYNLETLTINGVTRTSNIIKSPSGKGLNVSRVASIMGYETLATGFLGDNLSTLIKDTLKTEGIKSDFQKIHGETRNSVAILHDGGQQTEILETGPTISNDEATEFLSLYDSYLAQAKVVVLAGSLPKGISPDFYTLLIKKGNESLLPVILDASGETLKEVLADEINPYAIKPNLDEIQELTQTTIDPTDLQTIITLLDHPIFDGISLIMISMGKDGAFVKFEDKFYKASVPKIKVVNAVGSGDSTVAGLAIGIANDLSIEEMIKTSMTLGTLNALEERTGFVTKEHFDDYFAQVTVEKIERQK